MTVEGPAEPVLLALVLTPRGHLLLADEGGFAADAVPVEAQVADRLKQAFGVSGGDGLLQLGAGEVSSALPPVFAYWRDFSARFVSALCSFPEDYQGQPEVPAPPGEELQSLAETVPPMTGAEYVSVEVLRGRWAELNIAFARRLERGKGSVQDVLRRFNPAWNTVGRVHFHLAENRRDPDAPFAFLATYTQGLSLRATPQHVPLGRALQEYAGAANKARLLSLLLPVQRAAERCDWLRRMVEEGEIFHPLRWEPRDALAFLQDVHALEQAGVVVRVPANWKAGRPARPKVAATVGTKPASGLGLETLLDFRMEVTLDGETLTPSEVRALLAGTEGLAFLRGRWVELDREQLGKVIDRFRLIDRAAETGGLTFAEAMRLVAGADVEGRDDGAAAEHDWAAVAAGPWLSRTLQALRAPESIESIDPGESLRGTLRPYQKVGVRWLHFLSSLGLGACLADDMGLGKTVQVLALMLVLQRSRREERPHLLIAPASVIANWSAEIARFAPSLKTFVAHQSAVPAGELMSMDERQLAGVDLVITTFGSARRLDWLAGVAWDLIVVDEAQALKNPQAKQTRAIKALRGRGRIAMTGTPIENRLGDLWSIFDFINPGLLGSGKQFTTLTKRLSEDHKRGYGPLRELVRPYVLRRLKTDRTVIADLPEKTEVNAYCLLSRTQAALYDRAVRDLRDRLARSEGIERRGMVLASLMRLKQICNHPSQWLGDGAWGAAESGKFGRLAEIAEVIASRQEKVLVFTQFREVT
ncbi:MAG: DEAD/DEAH box helicase, partial [Acidobacteria bacterium]